MKTWDGAVALVALVGVLSAVKQWQTEMSYSRNAKAQSDTWKQANQIALCRRATASG